MAEESKSNEYETDADYRRALFDLFLRMSFYYLVLAAGGALMLYFAPALWQVLPVGGLSDFAARAPAPVWPQITGPDGAIQSGWLNSAIKLFLAMLSALLLMIPVSWVHTAIHTGDEYDHSIDETALILPAVVAGIVTVVQYSLALAFSLAGIMAGVRFRRALADTFDTLFIFVAIGVGLAAGVGAIEIAVIMTVFFNYSTILNCAFGDGLESKFTARRKTERRLRKAKKQSDADRAPAKADEPEKPVD